MTPPLHQLTELLVRQRLDGRGVEDLAAPGQREVDGELPDHGLARSGGGGHQHRAALLEGAAAVHLEIVQREGVPAGEGPQLGVLQLLLFGPRSEEHTSELQSRGHLVCRLLLEKKKYTNNRS